MYISPAKYMMTACIVACCLVFVGFIDSPNLNVTGSDGPQEPAVYYLVGGDAETYTPQRVSVEQINKQFAPNLVALPVGSTVAFPNRDEVMHNVYSPDGVLGFFDMGSAKKTLADNSNLLSKTLDKGGYVNVSCAIHPVMQADIFVVPSKYYAVSADGTYAFDSVPPGSYEIMVITKGGTPSKLRDLAV